MLPCSCPWGSAWAWFAVLGPALYLAGRLLDGWAITGRWSGSRPFAIVALAVTGAVALRTELFGPLTLSTATTVILLAVAVRDRLVRHDEPMDGVPIHGTTSH